MPGHVADAAAPSRLRRGMQNGAQNTRSYYKNNKNNGAGEEFRRGDKRNNYNINDRGLLVDGKSKYGAKTSKDGTGRGGTNRQLGHCKRNRVTVD